MRIAYICADPGIPVFGTKGASIHVQEVVRGFLRRGVEVELFANRLEGIPPVDLRRAGLHWLPALPRGELAVREQASIGANVALDAALRSAGKFDFIYERYSLWSFRGMEYAREKGIPGLLEVNAPLIEEQERHRTLIDRTSALQVAERVFAAASTIVVVSTQVGDYLARFSGTAERVRVIPNGVNTERFRPGLAPVVAKSRDAFVLGFVGTLKPWHGLTVLGEAFAELHSRDSSMRLLIAGSGPERNTLEEKLTQGGALEATTFLGAIPASRVPNVLASMDVAIAPYPAEENFYFSPLKIFEYMAAGLPIVASSIGQIPEVLDHGVTGILCPPSDSAAVAAAVEQLRESPSLRERLGRAAREQAVAHHTWRSVLDQILMCATGSRSLAGAHHARGVAQ
jgi:glycosyltransferase involved in cell wall biosynthesis